MLAQQVFEMRIAVVRERERDARDPFAKLHDLQELLRSVDVLRRPDRSGAEVEQAARTPVALPVVERVLELLFRARVRDAGRRAEALPHDADEEVCIADLIEDHLLRASDV